MKLVWNSSAKQPAKSGPYLVWDTCCFSHPFVAWFDVGDKFSRWFYMVPSAIAGEALEDLIYDKLKHISKCAGMSDDDFSEALETMPKSTPSLDDIGAEFSADISPPAWWCELPVLWDFKGDGVSDVAIGGDPSQLEVSIVDARTEVANRVADIVGSAFMKAMSDFEPKKEAGKTPYRAPWEVDNGNT